MVRAQIGHVHRFQRFKVLSTTLHLSEMTMFFRKKNIGKFNSHSFYIHFSMTQKTMPLKELIEKEQFIPNFTSMFQKPMEKIPKLTPHITIGFVLQFKDQILLVKQKASSLWSLPKGRPRPVDVSVLDVAIRELHSETGISMQKEHVHPRFWMCKNGVYFFHRYHTLPPTEILDEVEIEQLGWFSLRDILPLKKNFHLNRLVFHLAKNEHYSSLLE